MNRKRLEWKLEEQNRTDMIRYEQFDPVGAQTQFQFPVVNRCEQLQTEKNLQ